MIGFNPFRAILNFPRAIRQSQLILDTILMGDPAEVTRITRIIVDRWFKENLADYSQPDHKSIQETIA